ncbi:hypothetical protein [Streptomyces sp. CRN 30]|uniref:hypothetical protein n=1 Tax=Streptomyces sp. CRN 30 TaxID=3075613 RepID=UPI002A7EEF25|nr:hypothetical protein [Streptomyces sp. CRN 30]
MPTSAPEPFDRVTALRTAQQHAYAHALAAQQHYDQADEHHAEAARLANIDAYAARESKDRKLEQEQHERRLAEQAGAMAETWSRLTAALAVPATADGQPTTYDLHVAVDPASAQQVMDQAAANTIARTGHRRT